MAQSSTKVVIQQNTSITATHENPSTGSKTTLAVHNRQTTTATTGHQQASTKLSKCRATQTTPAWNKLTDGEPVALDIEFQNFKHKSWEKWRHRVGQVAIVNSKGETVLDVYAAYPKEDGVEKQMPPARFMVTYRDLRYDNGAKPAFKVERWVKQIVRSRTVIVHGGTHDRTAFTVEPNVFVNSRVIDTQRLYRHLQPEDGTPSLKTAAWEILSVDIQADDRHSAVEDAQTAMKLWSHHQKPGRRGDDSDTITSKGDEQRDVIDSRHWRIDDDQVEWDRRNGRRLYYTPGGALLDV